MVLNKCSLKFDRWLITGIIERIKTIATSSGKAQTPSINLIKTLELFNNRGKIRT